ncbi:alcohol dehydrogenase [Colletotrichum plurivorum]|uniref:Alcohol dehydrogenase n=1 Tax=Colletotrichum plurivorum TaxID=2175906 RepID=A0A8H6JNT7_9PEZI|nr:alcohol dehydrogenase [Colletotrichum plurivorum]
MSRSIYLAADGSLSITTIPKPYTPSGSQSLVSVKYSGINRCDLNFFHLGLHSYPTGFEFAGIVTSPGPNSPFSPGDLVCGISPISNPQQSCHGTHQDLVLAESSLTHKIPPGIDLKEASSLPMSLQTAADAIFNVLGTSLPEANVPGSSAKGRAILIWGGATAVGVSAIQLAKLAGFNPIFATASPRNHLALQALGATHVFDYASPTVTSSIRAAALELGVSLTTAFDTIGSGLHVPGADPETTSPALIRKCLSADEAPRLVCTLPVQDDPSFGFCNSYRPEGSTGAMGGSQDPEFPVRLREVVAYVLGAAERVPRHPNITSVRGGEEGIREIQKVAHGGASLQKIVIEHPM